MFPAPAGSFPDLATSAAAAMTATKEKKMAALQPIRDLFTDIIQMKGTAPAEGGSASSESGGQAAPAVGGGSGSADPKA
eukprot:3936841-Alexandrium_andersonii.AAC.1